MPRLNQSGSKNPNWKGGLIQSSKGYFYVYKPDHPRAGKGGYIKRANLVLEKKLGRTLKPDEIADHGPGGKADDSPENLTLMTISKHAQRHGKENSKKRWEGHIKKPKKILQPNHPSNRRYAWPSNEHLLTMRKTMSLPQIAKIIGCTWQAVGQRINRIMRD